MSKNDRLVVLARSRTLRTLKFMPTLDWRPEANDVIIPLIGPIGAGKSTFINFIAGKEVTTVGHGLQSCTAKFLPVVISSLQSDLLKDGRLVLVDTPGFDDTKVDDTNIVSGIDSWLDTKYGVTKLAGIVYLHDMDMSLPRKLEKQNLKDLDVIQKLCGKDALKRVVLCTTKWSEIGQEEGERRTEQLKEIYRKEMTEGGSTVHKFEYSQKSAWDVIVPIIKEDRFRKIQEELEKLIPDTEEGPQLQDTVNQLLKSLKQASSNDFILHKELDDQIAATRLHIRAIPVTPGILGLIDFVDKIVDFFIPPLPSGGNKLSAPPGTRLNADVKEVIMLLGETETSCERLLATLPAADRTVIGSGEQPTSEVRCWSVRRENLKPLFVIAAPSFGSHQGDGNPAIFEKVRTWLWSSCREDMKFGIIFLHSSLHPPAPFEELIEQSRLKSSALLATFAREATGAVEYGFDGSVASFQETSEQVLEMFDIALRNPVSLDLLLEKLRTISEGVTNKKGKGLKSWF